MASTAAFNLPVMSKFGPFFEKWRLLSDWLANVLVVACGLMCFVGALQAHQAGGPAWIVGLMVIAGLVLIAAITLRKFRRG